MEAFNFYETPALDFSSSPLTDPDSRGSPSTQMDKIRCQPKHGVSIIRQNTMPGQGARIKFENKKPE